MCSNDMIFTQTHFKKFARETREWTRKKKFKNYLVLLSRKFGVYSRIRKILFRTKVKPNFDVRPLNKHSAQL